jgi:predicted ester cyclase
MPSPEEVVRQFHDYMNQGDATRAAELMAEDAVNHGFRVGREGVAAVLRSLIQAFPDQRGEIVDLVAVGEVVAYRITVTGTHEGTPDFPFVYGGLLAGVAPTHRPIKFTSSHWFRVRDGEIVEHGADRDDLTMGRQLGLLPPHPSRPTK